MLCAVCWEGVLYVEKVVLCAEKEEGVHTVQRRRRCVQGFGCFLNGHFPTHPETCVGMRCVYGCVCMCVCACYVCVHTHKHVSAHLCAQAHMSTFVCVHTRVCMYIYTGLRHCSASAQVP